MTTGLSISDDELAALDLSAIAPLPLPFGEGDRSLEMAFAPGVEAMRHAVRTRFAVPEGGRVLDLLGGFGRWALLLAEISAQVVVVDRLKECCALGEELARRAGLENIEFVAGELKVLRRMRARSFDTIWMWSALQYVDRGKTLAACRKLLKPGGRLVIGAYNSVGVMLEHVEAGIDSGSLFEGASAWALNGLAAGPDADGTPNFATVESCADLCDRHGFQLVGAAPSNALDLSQRDAVPAEDSPMVRGYPRTIELVATKAP